MSSVEDLLSSPFVRPLATIAAAALLVTVAVRAVRRAIRARVSDSDLRYRSAKFVGVIGYFIVIVVIAAELGGRLSGFTVALGAASAGIAFALQEVIASFAGWLAIALGGFYKVGDRVQLGGITGDVIDIGFVRTTLMEVGSWVKSDLYNGRIVKIANSFVFKEPVFNYSADFPFLWDEIKLPVRYGSDWKAAKAMLAAVGEEVCADYARRSKDAWQGAVAKYRLEAAPVEPMVTLAATDNWLELTLRYIVDYRQRRAVKDQLFTRVLEEVDRSEGRVRLASTTLEIVNIPRMDIERTEGGATVAPRYVP